MANPVAVLGKLMNERIDLHEDKTGGDPYYHAGQLVSRELRWLWAEFHLRMEGVSCANCGAPSGEATRGEVTLDDGRWACRASCERKLKERDDG